MKTKRCKKDHWPNVHCKDCVKDIKDGWHDRAACTRAEVENLKAALEEIRPMADNASYSIGTPVNTLIAIAEIATAALAKARGTDETQ